jgi:hypothetical protein
MYYQILDTSCLSHLYNYLKTKKHITYPIENNTILKIKQYTNLDFYIIVHKNNHYYYSTDIESFIKNLNNYYLYDIFEKDRDQFINLCNIVDTFKDEDDEEYIINVMKGYDNFKNRVQHPFYMTDQFRQIEYNFDIFTLLK